MKKSIIVYFAIILCSYGCSLNEEIEDNFTPKDFIKGEKEAIAAINGVYHTMTRTGLYRRDWFALTDVGADDISAPSPSSYRAIDGFTYTSTNPDIEDVWQFNYFGINRANTLLDRIDQVPINDEQLRKRIQGEALFLRALFYQGLVALWGKAHIKSSATTTSQKAFGLSGAEKVYEFIEKDLLKAEKLLPVSYSGDEVWRATSGAATALLARVYLYQKKWKLASETAQKVVKSGKYTLFPTVAALIDIKNENGMEHIFSVQGNSYDWDTYSDLGNFYYPADHDPFWGRGRFRPELDFYNSFDASDLRRKEFFLTEYKGDGGAIVTVPTGEPPYGNKYRTESDSNYPLLRLAEMYLIIAEAENESNAGPTTQAYEAINAIRRRAFEVADSSHDTPTGLNQEQFRAAVRQERRWELCFEGHRRIDLTRWGTLVEAIQKQDNTLGRSNKPVKKYMEWYPIPQREIDLNKAISQQDQNPGY